MMYAYSIRLHTYIYIYTHIVYVYNQLYNYICTRVNVNPPSLGSLKELVEKYKVFVRSRRFIVSLCLSLSLAAMRSQNRLCNFNEQSQFSQVLRTITVKG